MIALDEERAEGALRECAFLAFLFEEHAEFHVDIRQLREGVVVAVERRAAEREQTLLLFGKNVRFHPADFVQPDAPFRQRRIVEELREMLVLDRLDLRDDEAKSPRRSVVSKFCSCPMRARYSGFALSSASWSEA